MSGGEIAAYVVGLGTFFTGLAALITARSSNNKSRVEGTSIGETSLANAVKVVEEVYEKVTVRLNVQIDELLEDNKKLSNKVNVLDNKINTLTISEEACRAEVTLLRSEVKELRAAS